MAYKKGQSGNPAGRRTGTPNKSTRELRSLVQDILISNFSQSKIARDLKDLPPKNRLDFYIKLLEFTLPKLVPTEIQDEQKSSTNFYTDILNKLKEDHSQANK